MRDYVVLDVFTDTPLEGNPVAVFVDAERLSGEVMQAAAREMNLSETVFLFPGDAESDASVRIFTPGSELPFAGHPVLGTAFFVGERDGLDVVRLRCPAGVIPITLRRSADGAIEYGEMEQPLPALEPFDRVDELLTAVGVERSELPVVAYRQGPLHAYVMLPGESAVAELAPDISALNRLDGVCANCFAADGRRVKTRVFAPGVGVVEDPATGSAAGPLALHLARNGRIAFGDDIEIRQGAEIGRPSLLYARVEGSAEAVSKVLVGGNAVAVARGSYRLD
jgi:trans-2,3-dihydro-3-hydroxyanthranilate isomerase